MLETCVANPAKFLGLAQQDSIKAALRANTAIAQDLNIFGAPTFRVGNELFWGDDRLDDAISWFKDNRDPGKLL